MSVSRASFLKMATPSGSRRLSVIPRLLRCRFWKSKPWRLPPMPSPLRPPGISILIAWAPQSTSWRTHVGPARARVRSSTEKRDRGRAPLLAMMVGIIPRAASGAPADQRLGEALRVFHLERVVAFDVDHRRVLPAAGHELRVLQRQLRAAAAAQDRHRAGGSHGVLPKIVRHVGEAERHADLVVLHGPAGAGRIQVVLETMAQHFVAITGAELAEVREGRFLRGKLRL